jgi:hypothetical protein
VVQVAHFASCPARDTISKMRYPRSLGLGAGVLEAHAVVEKVCFRVTHGGLESPTLAS